MRYPESFIEKVINAARLEDIIGQYTELKPSGRGLVGKCPFPDHQEKTASFHVSMDKQLYHCFGCKKGGNVIGFLQSYSGLGFKDSIEYLANRYNIPLPQLTNSSYQDDTEHKKQEQKKRDLLEIAKLARDFFHHELLNLPKDHAVRSYLTKRKLSDDMLEEFSLGWAPEGWEQLSQFLQKKKVPLKLAEEIGLVRARKAADFNGAEANSGYYDMFRARLMFPIQQNLGETIAFGGRVLDDTLPKYINSPESPIYHKGKTLYGLYQTAKHIRAKNHVIVVEGYMDLIALYQAGIKNLCAPLGTAFTADQARSLVKLSKNVMVLFDGDAAGKTAARKALPLLLEQGALVKGLTLPEGRDPDEFVKEYGAKELLGLLKKSKDLFSLVVEDLLKDGYQGTASDKIDLTGKIRPYINSIKDKNLKNLYIKELANKLAVDNRWLVEVFNETMGASNRPTANLNYGGGGAEAIKTFATGPQLLQPTTPLPAGTPGNPTGVEGGNLESVPLCLKGCDKAELMAFSLATSEDLKGPKWESILHAAGSGGILTPSFTQLIEKTQEIRRHQVKSSVSLVGLLLTYLAEPEQLTRVSAEVETILQSRAMEEGIEEASQRLFADCMKKIRLIAMEKKIKQLAAETRVIPSAEKLENLAKLQKERLALIKNSSERVQ